MSGQFSEDDILDVLGNGLGNIDKVQNRVATSTVTKECRFCLTEMSVDATFCGACGKDQRVLSGMPSVVRKQPRIPRTAKLFLVLIGLVILSSFFADEKTPSRPNRVSPGDTEQIGIVEKSISIVQARVQNRATIDDSKTHVEETGLENVVIVRGEAKLDGRTVPWFVTWTGSKPTGSGIGRF